MPPIGRTDGGRVYYPLMMGTSASQKTLRSRTAGGACILLAALSLSASTVGCCGCCDDKDRDVERTVETVKVGGFSIEFLAVAMHHHKGNIDFRGKWGNVGAQEDHWYPELEISADAPYARRTLLYEIGGADMEGGDEVEAAVENATVAHCLHPSGSALVFRVPNLETPAKEFWQAVYALKRAAANSKIKIPVAEAPTCKQAAARFPEPLQWIRDELAAPSDKDPMRMERRVAVRTEGGLPSTTEYDEDVLTGYESDSGVGFIVATQEGLLLEEAFDWSLQVGGHGRIGFFRHALEHGGSPGLEHHILATLEPKKTEAFSQQDERLDELVAVLKDTKAQREAVDKLTSQCALRAHRPYCRAWRLRMAGKIVGRLGDRARCDRLLDLLPDIAPNSAEDLDPGDATNRERVLLQTTRTCATPALARKSAGLSLGVGTNETNDLSHCNIDPTAPTPTDECKFLPFYAASLLVADCHPDAVKAAHASLRASDWAPQRAAAACVIGRCEGRAAYRSAVAKAGLAPFEQRVSVCGLDASFASDGDR